jgi:Domain of unknown function (DUF4359)
MTIPDLPPMSPPSAYKPALPKSRPLQAMRWTGYAAIAGLGLTLALTNPKQEIYTEFATRTVSKFLVRDLCKANTQTPKGFETLVKDGCQAFMHQGSSEIHSFIEHNTERQDFLIFSLYTTDFPIRPLRVLGIFNHFFLVS